MDKPPHPSLPVKPMVQIRQQKTRNLQESKIDPDSDKPKRTKSQMRRDRHRKLEEAKAYDLRAWAESQNLNVLSDRELYDKLALILHKYSGLNDVQVIGIDPTDHIHYLQRLKDLERKRCHPLVLDDEDFPLDETRLIYQPGTSFSSMKEIEREEIKENLYTMMLYSEAADAITNSGTQTLKQPKKHGTNTETDGQGKPYPKPGKMYAAGWHRTMGERGLMFAGISVLKPYGIKAREIAIEKFANATAKLAGVAKFFRKSLTELYPLGQKMLEDHAERFDVPSFDQLSLLEKGTPVENMPFANSLTITNGDFANYQHMDADAIEVAYGMWWAAKKVNGGWVLDDDCDHDKIKGGQFLIGEYGIAIDFEKASGLVEIYWRGKVDHHGTLTSVSQPGYTRFGTSIQITRKLVQGFKPGKNMGRTQIELLM
ncbi:hypothetical protein BDP27DRAFT_1435243 [Rhodocollybia butyracea]|uniref:Tet-like 2OG-Fe(II) oxygenase domain-containing protein n=1 Tax=Rhodocollybia butyracea TaxID=206335 RepID=A0A9P5TVZ1_9AGAR|nr:hypothetical protein BDP27DRAFT_1435243 [Rhodocollybia butyracea]